MRNEKKAEATLSRKVASDILAWAHGSVPEERLSKMSLLLLRLGGGKMKSTGDIEKIYEAGELLDEFCAETACPACPIRKLCNQMDKKLPIGQKLIRSIEN